MSIRLYISEKFKKGARLQIPESELRYFRSVRRSQGAVVLFNSFGEEAKGQVIENDFEIEEVVSIDTPLWPISLGVALPDSTVAAEVIHSASELGVAELFFFEGGRSQGFKKRYQLERFQKIAIEACRQSGRSRPLHLLEGDWKSPEFHGRFQRKFFFDESGGSFFARKTSSLTKDPTSILALIGCEGGWTSEERELALSLQFEIVHLPTPVLRVKTAVPVITASLMNQFFWSASAT